MDHHDFRRLMPAAEHWAYLDHAAVAPITARARDALAEWAEDVANHGVVHEPRWLKRVEEVRGRFAELLGADAPDVAFVKNTSEGVGIVAEGFPWRPGDNVVTSADEYPANVYPWLNLASRSVEVRRVPSRRGRVFLDDLRAAMDARTRIVTLSWVEFATGFRNDLDAVGQLCRERGALFFVDAIQALGVQPLDVSRTPIDFLAADGHKWLLGPEGAGVFWVRRELVERLHPVGVGWHSVVGAWDFAKIDFRLKPNAGRWESGSRNMGGIVALGASLDALMEVGVEALAARIFDLTERLCQRAERAGWRVYSSRAPGEWSGIVSLEPPSGRDPAAVAKALRGQQVAVNHRGGRLRVSPHAYNTEDEIDRLVTLLGEMP
jgi:selenocysteine lyase/cysteine desulfurase